MTGWTPSPDAWAQLGARIRAERERRGWSRKELGELADVSPSSVQSAERGAVPKTRWPQSLSAIERALDWGPGSMIAILEGGEPLTGGAPTRAPEGTFRSAEASAQTQSRLPAEVLDALPAVMSFGAACARHGAPAELAAGYDQAAAALLRSLYEPPKSPAGGFVGSVWSGQVEELGRLANRVRDLEQTLADIHEENRQMAEEIRSGPLTVGEKLQLARAEAGKSVEGVAAEARLSVDLIHAIERNDWVHADDSHVIAYSRVVDVDPQPLIEQRRRTPVPKLTRAWRRDEESSRRIGRKIRGEESAETIGKAQADRGNR